MSAPNAKPKRTAWQRLKRNLFWWAIFCAVYYGIGLILFFHEPTRNAFALTGAFWLWIPLALAPYLAIEFLFYILFDAVVDGSDERNRARFSRHFDDQ